MIEALFLSVHRDSLLHYFFTLDALGVSMIFTRHNGKLVKGVNFIPFWIVEAVQSRRLPLKTVFEADKLMGIVPKADLCGYLALDNVKFQDLLFGGPPPLMVGSNIPQDTLVVYNPLNNYNTLYDSMAGKDAAQGNDFMLNIAGVCHDQSVQDEVEARLFTEGCRNQEHKKPFIIYDITPERFGVVIYPGFFTGGVDTLPLQMELMESLQKELYVHVPYNDVCASPLFGRYLARMGSQDLVAT